MPDAAPAVRSLSPTDPAAIAFLHSATARSSLRSTRMRSPYPQCNSYAVYRWRMNMENAVKFAGAISLYAKIS
jgi:hypothetical protein